MVLVMFRAHRVGMGRAASLTLGSDCPILRRIHELDKPTSMSYDRAFVTG